MAIGVERTNRSGILPRGRLDVARQIALFIGAYALYELVRGLVGTNSRRPFANATHVINFERSLHIFAEPHIEAYLQAHAEWATDVASWIYVNAHFTVTIAALVVIYLRWNDSFNCVRNTFLVAMGIALIGYSVFPTAPPRLMTGYGFTDPVAQLTGLSTSHGLASVLFNPYAAIPSMHVCFAVMVGGPLSRLVRAKWLKVLWALYPVVIVFVVIATGNHYFTDVTLGILTAGVSELVAARVLARARPDVWAFAGAPA